jgi:hypothetical protein
MMYTLPVRIAEHGGVIYFLTSHVSRVFTEISGASYNRAAENCEL